MLITGLRRLLRPESGGYELPVGNCQRRLLLTFGEKERGREPERPNDRVGWDTRNPIAMSVYTQTLSGRGHAVLLLAVFFNKGVERFPDHGVHAAFPTGKPFFKRGFCKI